MKQRLRSRGRAGRGREVTIKTEAEIEAMRQAGRVVAEVLAAVPALLRAGTETAEIDRVAENIIRARGATPSFKGYNGFPASVCVSVNDEVVHGLPGRRRLRAGDIVGVDVGAVVEGRHADAAATFEVGEASSEARRLVRVTRQALYDAISQARAGRTLRDIARAVERRAAAAGYAPVRELTGHGIGRDMHEPPQVANYEQGAGPLRLEAGMTLAIEPMINAGGAEIVRGDDGWTFRTADGSLSAHWEHTVVVREEGAEIITVPLGCAGGG